MTMKSNSKFKKEGDFLAAWADPIPKDRARLFTMLDKLLPGCSDEELRKLHDMILWDQLSSDDPEEKREALSTLDKCPCCDRWLGHNRSPADDDGEDRAPHYRRQGSLKL